VVALNGGLLAESYKLFRKVSARWWIERQLGRVCRRYDCTTDAHCNTQVDAALAGVRRLSLLPGQESEESEVSSSLAAFNRLRRVVLINMACVGCSLVFCGAILVEVITKATQKSPQWFLVVDIVLHACQTIALVLMSLLRGRRSDRVPWHKHTPKAKTTASLRRPARRDLPKQDVKDTVTAVTTGEPLGVETAEDIETHARARVVERATASSSVYDKGKCEMDVVCRHVYHVAEYCSSVCM
jgi:hypothetical protein